MSKQKLIERIAKVCHEANKAYCETFGDYSQPKWEDAPDWQKESAINGVKFHLDNPDMTPEQSHENWMKEKLDNGWKWGAVKDPEKKEHPDIKPYSEVPKEEQIKDALFRNIVHAFI
jgi:hypothetical protein